MSNATFRDVYDYIQEADRDSEGRHYPSQTDVYPVWSFHIYEGRRQVNIDRQDHPRSNEWPRAALIFYPEEDKVRLVRCNNCIANYDEENFIPIDTQLDSKDWIELLVDRMHTDADYKVVENIQHLLIDTINKWYDGNEGDPTFQGYIKDIVSDQVDKVKARSITSYHNSTEDIVNEITPIISNIMFDVMNIATRKLCSVLMDYEEQLSEMDSGDVVLPD